MHPLRKLLTFLVALVVLVIGGGAFVYRSLPPTETPPPIIPASLISTLSSSLELLPTPRESHHPSNANAPSKAFASSKPASLLTSSSPALLPTTSLSRRTPWP